MKKLKIVIITGLSGSGKSISLAAFEDAGYYCVDNLPVTLLPKFLELPIEKDPDISGLAFVMDLREKNFINDYKSTFDILKENSYNFEILFLEADYETLLRRFSQTRRHHPLSNNKNLLSGMEEEQKQLKNLREIADKVINTSKYNVHELKSIIFDIAKESLKIFPLKINILSFGFKYGIPRDIDLIIDVRFLANPYFISELKFQDGEKEEVKNYILNTNEAKIFLNKYLDLLDFLIPLYEKEGKSYLTIGIGCTGGRHRSVAIARIIYEHIFNQKRKISINHRDINRETYI